MKKQSRTALMLSLIIAFDATINLAFACEALGLPSTIPCPSAPWETVGLEHEDRVKRLSRLGGDRLGLEFVQETISRGEHGLSDFPTDIPILRVIANQELFFDSASDKIRQEAYELLDVIADSLKREPPDVSLFVAGHTDSDGGNEYNMDLGFRRAAKVSEALLRRGIYQASIYRISFGEHMPISTNATWSGKARNRRVEFLFGAKVEAIVPYLAKQEIEFCGNELGNANCEKQEIVFKPQRIVVSPQSEEIIIELKKQEEILRSDKEKISVEEFEEKKQFIEFSREQIPVNVIDERIYIEFKN